MATKLHMGFAKDLRTADVSIRAHYWINMGRDGMERLCDGLGERDGIGPTIPILIDLEMKFCLICQSIYARDLLHVYDKRGEPRYETTTRDFVRAIGRPTIVKVP